MLTFEILDWADAGDARGVELRATWARLRISVGQLCATRVVSRPAAGTRDHIFVPLYPLAEWLVANWWFLQGEIKTPRSHYALRHSLKFSGDGFAFPDLAIKPLGHVCEIEASKRLLQHQELEFLAEGRAYAATSDVMNSIERFVTAVLQRLDDSGVTATPLHEEWRSVVKVRRDAEEVAFCLLSASLGEDPYSVGPGLTRSLERWGSSIEQETLQEICAALTSSTLERGLRWIDRTAASLKEAHSPWTSLPELKEKLVADSAARTEVDQPWLLGYADARRLRKSLKLNGDVFSSFYDLLDVFRPEGDASVGVAYEPPDVTGLDALAQVSKTGAPGFLITKRGDDAKKFAFMRSLYDYFRLAKGTLAIATRSHSQIQQASRAFAAEFLAPSHLLRGRIAAEYLGGDEISELADYFGVSEFVIQHQVVNHHLADVIYE